MTTAFPYHLATVLQTDDGLLQQLGHVARGIRCQEVDAGAEDLDFFTNVPLNTRLKFCDAPVLSPCFLAERTQPMTQSSSVTQE